MKNLKRFKIVVLCMPTLGVIGCSSGPAPKQNVGSACNAAAMAPDIIYSAIQQRDQQKQTAFEQDLSEKRKE